MSSLFLALQRKNAAQTHRASNKKSTVAARVYWQFIVVALWQVEEVGVDSGCFAAIAPRVCEHKMLLPLSSSKSGAT